jgi:hypothetical protein
MNPFNVAPLGAPQPTPQGEPAAPGAGARDLFMRLLACLPTGEGDGSTAAQPAAANLQPAADAPATLEEVEMGVLRDGTSVAPAAAQGAAAKPSNLKDASAGTDLAEEGMGEAAAGVAGNSGAQDVLEPGDAAAALAILALAMRATGDTAFPVERGPSEGPALPPRATGIDATTATAPPPGESSLAASEPTAGGATSAGQYRRSASRAALQLFEQAPTALPVEARRGDRDAGLPAILQSDMPRLDGAPPVSAGPFAAPAAGPEVRPTSETPAPLSGVDQVATRQLDLARDSQWLDRLATDIARTAGKDGTLRFNLHPQSLGSLAVEVRHAGDGVSVRLTAETDGARAILADAQPRLAAEARAQGVRIAETHVDLGGQFSSGGHGGQHGHPPEALLRTERAAPENPAGRPQEPVRSAPPERYA